MTMDVSPRRLLVPGTLLLFFAADVLAQAPAVATVSGRVTVTERGNDSPRDVATSVVWLESSDAGRVAPDTVQIITADKQFRPNVIAVPVGSTVSFPNSDPFNHNVFSLSRDAPFDLGLFGRGQERSTRFPRPGIINVYCNVHARMTATIIVRDNPYFTQPAGDGSFVIRDVPAGRYTLRAWHARAAEFSQEIDVGSDGIAVVDVALDASRYRFVQHRNKYGRPYSRRGRRY